MNGRYHRPGAALCHTALRMPVQDYSNTCARSPFSLIVLFYYILKIRDQENMVYFNSYDCSIVGVDCLCSLTSVTSLSMRGGGGSSIGSFRTFAAKGSHNIM